MTHRPRELRILDKLATGVDGLSARPEQAPVGDSPDAGGERLHLAATGDDEAEALGVRRDTTMDQR